MDIGQTLISSIYRNIFIPSGFGYGTCQHVKIDSAWCGYYADANLARCNTPPDAKLYVYYPEVLSPEANLRPRPSMGQREEPRSGHTVQYLNNMGQGQNLSSTTGDPEFVAQEFFETPVSGFVNGGEYKK